jgi:hypothetical protein
MLKERTGAFELLERCMEFSNIWRRQNTQLVGLRIYWEHTHHIHRPEMHFCMLILSISLLFFFSPCYYKLCALCAISAAGISLGGGCVRQQILSSGNQIPTGRNTHRVAVINSQNRFPSNALDSHRQQPHLILLWCDVNSSLVIRAKKRKICVLCVVCIFSANGCAGFLVLSRRDAAHESQPAAAAKKRPLLFC